MIKVVVVDTVLVSGGVPSPELATPVAFLSYEYECC